MAEAVAAFHHLDAAAAHQFVGREALHRRAVEHDFAFGHLAAFGLQQVGDRLERGRLAGAVGAEQRHDVPPGHAERNALQDQDDVVVDDFDVVDGENRRGPGGRRGTDMGGSRSWARGRRRRRRLPVIRLGFDGGHQLVARHPGVMLFSAAYFAAASLTMGAITLSSLTYQSDVIFQFLPSQACMRPVRAPSWSLQETLTGCTSSSKPSSLSRSAVTLRFSSPQRTCSPVSGFLPNFPCAVRIASTPSMPLMRPRTYRTSPVSSHLPARPRP